MRLFRTAARIWIVAFSLLPPLQAASKPKLVVVVVVDQFRYDYLTRFRQDYHAGLNQLLTQGANFTNAFYAQMPTVTAVGHSVIMTGAMPSVSGMVGNNWYERAEKKFVTSVCDWSMTSVGAPTPKQAAKCTDSDPASPNRLLVTTLGDELRDAQPEAKVVGVSIKARGAILPSGHSAAGAFWFDDASGNFITSSFYMDKLPAWASEFNALKLPDGYVNKTWDGFPQWDFHSNQNPYAKLPASPWGNELIEHFAEQAIAGEKLGQRGVTDLLTVSFSSNDYVGHAVGPNAPEVRDMSIRTDQLLGKLFAALEQSVGMKDVLVVLSADHGVAATPEHAQTIHMPGGYLYADSEDAVQSALAKNFGKGDWVISGAGDASIYFNWETIHKARGANGEKIEEEDIYRVAKDALLATPLLHVARVYTGEQLASGVSGDFVARAASYGFYPKRSGDLSIVFDSGYMGGTSGTSHFSPWAYDRHVPVLLMGQGIKPGRYDETIEVNDIAPTLATMLQIQTPSGSSGKVLAAALSQ